MDYKLRNQIAYKIQHTKSSRISNIKGCKIKLNVFDTIQFYKNILYQKFNCTYQDTFYFVIDRTIQWYYKWYFDANNLQYEQFENKIRFQMYTYQINLSQIYFIFLQQKATYNLTLNLSKHIVIEYLKQCYKKTTGYQNLI